MLHLGWCGLWAWWPWAGCSGRGSCACGIGAVAASTDASASAWSVVLLMVMVACAWLTQAKATCANDNASDFMSSNALSFELTVGTGVGGRDSGGW